jgi:hypothetical protein
MVRRALTAGHIGFGERPTSSLGRAARESLRSAGVRGLCPALDQTVQHDR